MFFFLRPAETTEPAFLVTPPGTNAEVPNEEAWLVPSGESGAMAESDVAMNPEKTFLYHLMFYSLFQFLYFLSFHTTKKGEKKHMKQTWSWIDETLYTMRKKSTTYVVDFLQKVSQLLQEADREEETWQELSTTKCLCWLLGFDQNYHQSDEAYALDEQS